MVNKKEKKTVGGKRRLYAVIAAALALCLLAGGILLLADRSPIVMRYGGSTLREDAYSYWFSCYKYQYLVAYKNFGIEDTEAGWAVQAEDGKSYGEAFKAAIDKEIAMRFVASALYDATGATLSESALSSLEGVIADMEDYSYGEDMYDALKESYGIRKAQLKRVALYELKYKALLSYLYGADYSGVYGAEHKDAVESFYQTHYKRFSFVYLSDESGADEQASLRKNIAEGIDETDFAEWEREYSEQPISEKYPDGIYLYDGLPYADVFFDGLLSAFHALENAGDTVEIRNETNSGSYFVMRYSLPKEAYLSTDEGVKKSLGGFAEYAARALYREELEAHLADVEASDALIAAYTLPAVKKEKDYNVVNLLG